MRKVLLTTFLWSENAMGAHRARRLAKYLPRFGWEPHVLTPRRSPSISAVALHEVDWLNLAAWSERKAAQAKKRVQANDIYNKQAGLSNWLNRWLFIPDRQVTWCVPAVRLCRNLLEQAPMDLLFSTIHPRSTALIGARLRAQTGLPFALEYRDLWSGNPYANLSAPTPLHRFWHLAQERRVLRCTTGVAGLSQGICNYLSSRFPDELSRPPALHYNFFDPEEYPSVGRQIGRTLQILYAGSFFFSRTPEVLLEGVSRFIADQHLTPATLRFVWLGRVVAVPQVNAVVARLGLRDFIDYRGEVPHAQVLQELCRSDLAVIVHAPHDAFHLPGKFFEILGSGTPCLAVTPDGELADLVRRTCAGWTSAQQAEAIKNALLEMMAWRKSGAKWSYNEDVRQQFSASSRVAHLAAWMDRLASNVPTQCN